MLTNYTIKIKGLIKLWDNYKTIDKVFMMFVRSRFAAKGTEWIAKKMD
jgi:hypothetical protein